MKQAMKQRRRFGASVAVLMLLAACAPGGGDAADGNSESEPAAEGDDGNGDQAESSGDTTLSFIHDKPFLDGIPNHLSVAEDELGFTLDVTEYSDTTSYQQVVQTSLPSADAPDLITWWSGYRMEELAQTGNLLDLTDFWSEQVAAGTMNSDFASAFTFDDQTYAVPFLVSYWPVFYNVKVFDELGLSVPTTWDELTEVADALVANDVTPFYASVDGRWPAFIWFEEFLIRTDPEFYERLVAGEESYTDPLVMEAMQEWGEWIEKGYFSDLDVPVGDEAASMLANGDTAMVLLGTWFNGSFDVAGMTPGEDYDAFILPNRNPEITDNLVVFETSMLGIPKNARDTAGAMEFLEWWVQPGSQGQWSSATGDLPATPGAEASDPVLQNIVDTVDEGNYRLIERYWEASPPSIVEAAVDELSRFMLNPDQYESVLESIEALARQEWDARG